MVFVRVSFQLLFGNMIKKVLLYQALMSIIGEYEDIYFFLADFLVRMNDFHAFLEMVRKQLV